MFKKITCTKRKITLNEEEKKKDEQKERKINLVSLFIFLKLRTYKCRELIITPKKKYLVMKSKVWWSQVTRNLPPDRLIIYIWLIKFEVSLALFINK